MQSSKRIVTTKIITRSRTQRYAFQLGAGAELRREQIPHVFLRRDESREEGEARRQVRPSLSLLHRAEWAWTQADRY